MTEPIFVKIRNDEGIYYPSYTDIYQLADWNFPTCELGEVVPESDNIYVFLVNNGNVAACCLRPHTARYILWNLEIPGQVGTDVPDYMDEQWVSCRYWQSLSPNSKFVVLGGDVRLGITPEIPKEYDFCHISYLYGKRAEQVAQLAAQGYTFAPIGWGEVRERAIASAKWGLIMHQNPVPALSPQRMTLFACSRLPMIAEDCDPYPYDVILTHVWPPFVPDYHDYQAMAEHNYHYFTETMTFRAAVEGALRA